MIRLRCIKKKFTHVRLLSNSPYSLRMLELTAHNFDAEVTQFSHPVVVDFWASWCGPCRMMAPIFEELAKEIPDITFAKVNVDEAPELAMRFTVLSIPTFVVLKGGTEVGRFSGGMPKDAVKAQLARILGA